MGEIIGIPIAFINERCCLYIFLFVRVEQRFQIFCCLKNFQAHGTKLSGTCEKHFYQC